jgi:hypothetical protein
MPPHSPSFTKIHEKTFAAEPHGQSLPLMEARFDVTRTLALGKLGEPWQLLLGIFNQILCGVVRIRMNSSFRRSGLGPSGTRRKNARTIVLHRAGRRQKTSRHERSDFYRIYQELYQQRAASSEDWAQPGSRRRELGPVPS